MCYGCFQSYQTVVNDKVISAAKLIDAVYDEHCAGGNLHIVLDDYNVEDSSLRSCLDEPSEPLTPAEIACGSALLDMTEDERASAIALYDGIIDEQGRDLVALAEGGQG